MQNYDFKNKVKKYRNVLYLHIKISEMKNFIPVLFIMITIYSCTTKTIAQQTIRFVSLGDSYTAGTGADEEQSWPVLLTKHLGENKINIELIANAGVSGRTTQGLINYSLPILDDTKPTFVTLLIGVNDWIIGVDTITFQKNLIYIIEQVQKQLPDKSKLVLITLPDFSVTPSGKNYSHGRDVSKGISEFNKIIRTEANKRKLKIAELFESSKKMGTNPDWVSTDGLHPSAKGYKIWEACIYSVVYPLLK